MPSRPEAVGDAKLATRTHKLPAIRGMRRAQPVYTYLSFGLLATGDEEACVRRVRCCIRPTSEDQCGKTYCRLESDRPGAQENGRVGLLKWEGDVCPRIPGFHVRRVDSPIPSKQSNLAYVHLFFFPLLSQPNPPPPPPFVLPCPRVSPIPSNVSSDRVAGGSMDRMQRRCRYSVLWSTVGFHGGPKYRSVVGWK